LQPQSLRSRRGRGYLPWLAGLLGFLLVAFLIYQIPWVNERLAWRVDSLRTRIVYLFNPPDEAIFVPQQGQLADVAVITASPTPTVAAPTSEVRSTPTVTPTPLPPSVSLTGFIYIDQHGGWNLCGPATLAMALTYWGWEGTRNDVEDYVKPGLDDPNLDRVARGRPDKNVMPYEMEDFVDTQVAGLEATTRVGGELEIIKRLVAGGFPVVVEKGYTEVDATGRLSWLGHYLFVTGYDDAEEYFIVQDVYLRTGDNGTGANLHSSYEEFQNQWRAFNYLFMVLYPSERQDEVVDLLGPWANEEWANRNALEIATAEAQTFTEFEQFFALFNIGSSHVRLFQYPEAAVAYDQAFALYEALPNDAAERPYRMMWYQTGPYWAYYYSGRYHDVIDLANLTLTETLLEPTLEESLYWRGLARYAIGEVDQAIADLREAVRINPNFWAGLQQLSDWGVSP
jgi:hypothetical protein